MAGFGSLGGLGGASFPMRYGEPVSKPVQSDEEFNNGWTSTLDWLKSQAQQAQADWTRANGYLTAASDAGMSSEEAARRLPAFMGVGGLGTDATLGANLQNSAGSLWGQYSDMAARYPIEQQQRSENQIRQQQAYGSMTGWDQLNGVMGPGYTNPNFGQISGQVMQAANQQNMAPTTPGVDASWTSGVFDQGGGLTGVYGGPQAKQQRWL